MLDFLNFLRGAIGLFLGIAGITAALTFIGFAVWMLFPSFPGQLSVLSKMTQDGVITFFRGIFPTKPLQG